MAIGGPNEDQRTQQQILQTMQQILLQMQQLKVNQYVPQNSSRDPRNAECARGNVPSSSRQPTTKNSSSDEELKEFGRNQGSKTEIPYYYGRNVEDLLDWMAAVDWYFKYMQVPESMHVDLATHWLNGRVLNWWKQIQISRMHQGKHHISSWRRMKRLLRENYLTVSYVVQQFQNCRQCTQGVCQYVKEYQRLLNCYGKMENDTNLVYRFIDGLHVSIQEVIAFKQVYTLEDIIALAVQAELQLEEQKQLELESILIQSQEADQEKSTPKIADLRGGMVAIESVPFNSEFEGDGVDSLIKHFSPLVYDQTQLNTAAMLQQIAEQDSCDETGKVDLHSEFVTSEKELPGSRNLLVVGSSNLLESVCHPFMKNFHFIDSAKVYLSYALLKASVSPSPAVFQYATGILINQRTSVLRMLEKVCKSPQMFVDIFVNCDCDIEVPNLFECMVHAMSKVVQGPQNADPNLAVSFQMTSVKGSSLQCLVSMLKSLVEWEKSKRETDEKIGGFKSTNDIDLGNDSTSDEESKKIRVDVPSRFEKTKAHKLTMEAAVSEFNRHPTKGPGNEFFYLQVAYWICFEERHVGSHFLWFENPPPYSCFEAVLRGIGQVFSGTIINEFVSNLIALLPYQFIWFEDPPPYYTFLQTKLQLNMEHQSTRICYVKHIWNFSDTSDISYRIVSMLHPVLIILLIMFWDFA